MTGIDLKEKGHNALSFNFKGKFFWMAATLANPSPRILPWGYRRHGKPLKGAQERAFETGLTFSKVRSLASSFISGRKGTYRKRD